MKRPPAELSKRLRGVADDVLGPDRACSIDEVAARAGIPRATLYYYFSGRDELLDFLLLDKVEQMGAAVRAVIEEQQNPLEGLEGVLATAVRTIAAHPTLCTMLLTRLPVLSPTAALGAAVQHSVLRPLQDLLDAGVATGTVEVEDAELTAHALYGAVSMAALSQFARHRRIDADRLVGALVPRLVASVRAPQATPARRATGGRSPA